MRFSWTPLTEVSVSYRIEFQNKCGIKLLLFKKNWDKKVKNFFYNVLITQMDDIPWDQRERKERAVAMWCVCISIYPLGKGEEYVTV